MNQSFLFIVGRGRSGTWLMQSLLDAHPEISVAPESNFILNLYRKYKNGSWNEKTIENFVSDLFKDEKIAHWWKLSYDQVLEYLNSNAVAINSYADAVSAVYRCYAISKDKTNGVELILADKNPEYTRHIETLLKIFPEARVIALVRDPRANVYSFKKVSFDFNSAAALALRWNQYARDLIKAKNGYPKRVKVFYYEDVLKNTTQVLAEIEKLLGITGIIELQDSFFKKSSNVFSFNELIKQPIDQKRLSLWESELHINDIALINRVTRKSARVFGYSLGKSIPWPNLISFSPGLAQGLLGNLLEYVYFKLPFILKMWIIKAYRSKTNILEKEV